jgi:tetratricopeptide (TPR) repeat protein
MCALAAGEKAIALNPDRADAWAVTADALLNLGRYEEAIKAAGTAITMNPDMIEPYIIQGTAYGRMDEYKKMVTVSKQALEINPDDLRAQGNLHFAQVNGGEDTESSDSDFAEKTPFPLMGGILGAGVLFLMSRGRFR